MEQINWNQKWMDETQRNHGTSDVTFWDEFAPRFRKKTKPGEKDPYVEQFYDFSGIQPEESIFDMGCGPGTLAIPFAERGHEVVAADFSEGMLKHLMLGAEEAGVADRIHPVQLDWNEDWSRRDLPVCDVAIASRSLIFDDLTQSLFRLEARARRRVCLGAWDDPAKGYDRTVGRAIGYERPGYSCYYLVMGELMDLDRMPELRFIHYPMRRHHRYDSREELCQKIRSSFRRPLTAAQQEQLAQYLQEHARPFEDETGPYWALDHGEESTLAHIRWDVAK